ncbi:hypothetical protein [Brevibacillus laterosporus]|uniref:Uncharacterized protein n=1 Tax=Brevibacillus laterosporus TaxID=1465 RepID=A0AAP3DKX3_BRELA|nr:hypothetical protein [Brevibacillus laterosporus]MCR8983060.1 hypothetical protein [Brevibacillus laterosporus]MCZ0810216.1 hypothetical protein [Brevibacillus laterosporus]MCZ0828874.1 hypothetical protein [Brevibacillus laterosporus]MCZ0852928.1 hypothetical protein [Brevibacillus laterosporus]
MNTYNEQPVERSLRYLREELEDVSESLFVSERRCLALRLRRQTIINAINDIKREMTRIDSIANG